MIKVTVLNEHNFKVDIHEIQQAVIDVIKKNNGDENSCVSVAIVNLDEMYKYARKYLKETGEEAKGHPVLSFPTNEIEKKFAFHPDEKNYLGEIIVVFNDESTDKIVADLAAHGTLHLLGIHHD